MVHVNISELEYLVSGQAATIKRMKVPEFCPLKSLKELNQMLQHVDSVAGSHSSNSYTRI